MIRCVNSGLVYSIVYFKNKRIYKEATQLLTEVPKWISVWNYTSWNAKQTKNLSGKHSGCDISSICFQKPFTRFHSNFLFIQKLVFAAIIFFYRFQSHLFRILNASLKIFIDIVLDHYEIFKHVLSSDSFAPIPNIYRSLSFYWPLIYTKSNKNIH